MVARFVVLCALVARVASADNGTISIETHGIEVEVPSGWEQKDDGKSTLLAPKAYKSRALEVIALDAMPEATVEATQKLLGSSKSDLKVTHAKELQRYGVKLVVGDATMTANKTALDLEFMIFPQPKGATLLMSFIKADQDPVLKKANVDILLSARIAGPKMTVTVTETKTKGMGAPKELEDRISALVPKLDQILLLPRPLPITFKDCGFANAFYKPGDHTITFCHELFDDLVDTFVKEGMDKQKAIDAAVGASTFTFFHEFGHALVGELGLPITGKGEDAADEVSTLFLIAMKDEKAAYDGAHWFQSMVDQKHKNPFWDEHSFDQQRAVDIVCLLYGADQKKWSSFMKKIGVPDTRLARCKDDYPARYKAWDQMLEPHHRRTKKP